MKTAIITGTSSGLGESLAKVLLELGWKVYGASRRGNPTLSKESRYMDTKVDLTDMKQLKNFVSQVEEEKIDLLINNAGIVIMEKATNWSEETFNKIFSINYIAPIKLLNALFEKLDNSQVININSDSSHIAWDMYGTYGASKAALWHHMNALAQGNPNIQIINIHPEAFNSPLIDNADQEMIDERDEFMTIKQVSNFIIKIITKEQKFISGASIFIYNEWVKENLATLHSNQFSYNVDTGIIKRIESDVI